MVRINSIAAAVILMGTFAGCESGPRLIRAPALAKAKGSASFKKTSDHGTRIVLVVRNLAEPENLNPPGYSYVAWVQGDREAPPHNVGALVVDDEQQGELRTLTPLRDFELFVTAEPSSDVAQPTGPPLLWVHRDARIKLVRRDEWTRLAVGDAR
jgi:hypothetical protein